VRIDAPASTHFASAVPQFTVPDIVRTVEYYRDVLGFEVAGYWDGEQVTPTPVRPVFAIVKRDQVRVYFNQGDGAAVQTGRAEGAYDVYFHVVGVDALAGEFRSRGAEILDGPEDRSYGQRELVITDCNGVILAFGEDTSGRAT
jgi:catechol 2,3-dioxygenase-like lactoylglutathione lyase family enzyme